jgi:hypothetical protein
MDIAKMGILNISGVVELATPRPIATTPAKIG